MKTILVLLAFVVCTQASFSWKGHLKKTSTELSELLKSKKTVENEEGIWGKHKEWFKKMKKHLGQITEKGKKTAVQIWGNYVRPALEPTTASLELSPETTSEILGTTPSYQEQTTEAQATSQKGKPTVAGKGKWSKMSQSIITKMKKKWAKTKWGQRKDKKFWTKISGEDRRPSKMGGKPNRSKGAWAKNWFRKMWGKWGQKRGEQKD